MERANLTRRETHSQRHDADSPVISMKRLMQQLQEELEGLRQQQDALLKQIADQRTKDEENRSWVRERLETLDLKLQEATASASSIASSASAAAAAANAAAAAAAASAAAANRPAPGLVGAATGSSAHLLKTSSFEFAHHILRPSREASIGCFGSVNLASGSGPAGPAGASPLGPRSFSPLPGNTAREGDGLAISLGSPRRRVRRSPSSSDESAGTTSDTAARPTGRSTARARGKKEVGNRMGGEDGDEASRTRRLAQQGAAGAWDAPGDGSPRSAFAAVSAQAQAVREFAARGRSGSSAGGAGGSGGGPVPARSASGRRGEVAALRHPSSPDSTELSGSLQEAMPSFNVMPEGLTSLESASVGGAGGGGGGGTAATTAAAAGSGGSQPWSCQNLSTVSYGSSLGHSVSMGHGHHHHHHHQHQHLQHSYSHGHGHGHHHGHSRSIGAGGSGGGCSSGGGGRPVLSHVRSTNHGNAGAFGNVAMLFPTLRHGGSTDDLSGGAFAAAAPPLSPPLQQGLSSPRHHLPPIGSGTSYAGVSAGGAAGGGGGHHLGLDVARMSVSAAAAAAAPSLARESLPSAAASEPETERVEAASIKHFKGISPRLVEIYRQRAEQSHWSLQTDSVQLMATVSRRGTGDATQRSQGGLLRPSVMMAAAAAAAVAAAGTGGSGGGASRPPLLRVAGGSASGGGKSHEAGMITTTAAGGGGGGEDSAGWVLLDPNYDHPPMIGDDEEYFRPMTLLEQVKLYLVGLIRPEGRTKWDLFILALLAWVLFASPVIICFGMSGDAFNGDWVGIVELCVDAAFAFDIYLNFRTAYYDSKGHLVTERWRIARHYFKTWFLLDLVCVIPYDIITAGTMGFLSMLKLLRVMRVGKLIRTIRMYRLLRVIRLPRVLERMEMFIDRGVLQVMAFVLSVCLMGHLSACIFFYMAYLDGLGPQTWVAAYGVQDADIATKYLTSLYWAFTTTATVGYGDITPKTDKEKIIAIFVMCLGVSLVGYVTSSITNIMAIKSAQQTNIAARKQLVADVLKARSVPSELSRRVYNYFDYASSKMIKREEAALLAELPFKLRARLLTSFHADTLSRIPGISRLPPHVLIELVSQLKPHYFVEGDIVAMQGDYADGLYIVSEGLLEVRTYMFPADVEPWRIFEAIHKDELRYMPYSSEGRLKPRYFFGQGGVLHGGVWPATVIARNCCELYSLDREGLEHMLTLQPELRDMLGVPRTPTPASVAHAAFLSGPGSNPLLPPADRAVLLADFPLMDPAPQRGLVQSMLRSMGNMLTGGLARASAMHYPRMPGTPGSAATSPTYGGAAAGGAGGGGDAGAAGAEAGMGGKGSGRGGGGGARSVWTGLMGWRKGGGGAGAAPAAPAPSGGGGNGRGATAVEPNAAAESKFSRFRPFAGRRGPRNAAVLQLQPASEAARLLLDNSGERSDTNANANGGQPPFSVATGADEEPLLGPLSSAPSYYTVR